MASNDNKVDLSNVNKTKKQVKMPSLKNPLKKQKGPARDNEGKFTSGSGGLRQLNFNWKRVLPVILVIALTGGFLVYRGFAAANTGLTHEHLNTQASVGTSKVRETRSSKRNATVVQITNPAGRQTGRAVYNSRAEAGHYEVCMFGVAQKGAPSGTLSLKLTGSTSQIGDSDYSVSNTSAYQKLACVHAMVPGSGTQLQQLEIAITNRTPDTALRVSSIILEVDRTSTPTQPGGTASCANGPNFTSANICVNPASIKAPARGTNEYVNNNNPGYAPYIAHTDISFAAFRTSCEYSHTSKNDAIVYPGQKDAAHWHMFFGNTAADENLSDPQNAGNSTCEGGRHNKTAYWAPALVDTNSYNSSTKQFNLAQPIPNDPMQVYYKSGYYGVMSNNIVAFPRGLKMIAGANASAEPTGSMDTSRVWFDCLNSGHAQDAYNGLYNLNRLPTNCPPGKYIQATVLFPQCGRANPDGSPMLDSPNHRDHMAYPTAGRGCPSSHPIQYPEILEHFRWIVPSTGSSGLRFSSDMWPNRPAGWTFHADWFNGWDETSFNKIITNCYRIRRSSYPGGAGLNNFGLDCQMNLFEPINGNMNSWRSLGWVGYQAR